MGKFIEILQGNIDYVHCEVILYQQLRNIG